MEVRMVTTRVMLTVAISFKCISGAQKLTGILLLLLEELVDLGGNLTLGHADILLHVTVRGHELEETVIRDVELLHSC